MLLLSGLLWSVPALSVAQNPDTLATPQPLELLHADVMRQETRDGATITYVIGDVSLRQGETQLWCDRLTIFREDRRYLFEGNVRIQDPHRTLESERVVFLEGAQEFRCTSAFTFTRGDTVLKADRGVYDIARKRATCAGRVWYHDGQLTVQGDSAYYEEDARRITIDGHVTMTGQRQRVQITSAAAVIMLDEQRTLFTGSPRMVRQPKSGAGLLVATGETLELTENPFTIDIAGHARIVQDSLIAESDSARYLQQAEGETIRLRGRPRIFQNGQTLEGRTIDITVEEDAVRRVVAEQNALARIPVPVLTGDSLFNTLRGSTIIMHFADSALDRMTAIRNAEGFYYKVDHGRPNGGNAIQGETITVHFTDGQFARVDARGGSSGVFYPQNQLRQLNREDQADGDRQQ